MDTKTLDTIKSLLQGANAVSAFHAEYKTKYASDTNCDKKGYGFGRDDRFSAFSINTCFSSWRGYYGSSSASAILHVPDCVRPYFVKALNVHQEELFATVARLMRAEAASLRERATAEIVALQAMLDSTSEPTTTDALGAVGAHSAA